MVSTLDWTELLLPISRAQYLVTCSADEIERFAEEMPGATGAIARVVRGEWCATKKDAVWEIAQAFEFPKLSSWPRNWQALRVGLLDLSWMPASSYTLFIVNSDEMLNESEKQFGQLAKVVRSVLRERNRWDERALHMTHDRVPFHVVFHCEHHRRAVATQRL